MSFEKSGNLKQETELGEGSINSVLDKLDLRDHGEIQVVRPLP